VAFFAAQAGAGKRASTLPRRLAAIGYMHKIASVPSPIGAEAIKATLSGIRRSIGRRAGQEEGGHKRPLCSAWRPPWAANLCGSCATGQAVAVILRQGQQVCGHAEGLQDGLQHLRGAAGAG
jgi:hypothetical protein